MSLLISPLLELSVMLATMWLWTVRLFSMKGSQTMMWQWAACGPKMVQYSLVSVVVSLSQTSKQLLALSSEDSWYSLPWVPQWTMAHMRVWPLSLQDDHSLSILWWDQDQYHLLYKVRLEQHERGGRPEYLCKQRWLSRLIIPAKDTYLLIFGIAFTGGQNVNFTSHWLFVAVTFMWSYACEVKINSSFYFRACNKEKKLE